MDCRSENSLLGIDLIYEGIATISSRVTIWPDFSLLGIDLIYEGIATRQPVILYSCS